MTRELRLYVFLGLGLCLGGSATYASASAVPMTPPANVTSTPTGYVSNANSAFSGASFNSGYTANVAGKSVTMPATMRMAANAGQFAAQAVRMNAVGLIGAAVVAWLLPYGIEWIDGMWKQDVTPDPMGLQYIWKSIYGDTVAPSAFTSYANGKLPSWAPFGQPIWVENDQWWKVVSTQNSSVNVVFTKHGTGFCPAGYNVSGTTCVPIPAYQPATDAAWNQVATLPAAAANELTKKGVAVPLENPDFAANHADLDLTAPYLNPTTGQWEKKVARVTPNADGKTAEVQTVTQATDEQGNPAEDPATGEDVKPTTPENPCDQNPDTIGCSQWGEPEDADLETETKNITITPDSGWGASGATCPADLTYTLHQGTQIRMKWQPLCQMANTFRPIVVGLAWLSAILIFMGIARRTA